MEELKEMKRKPRKHNPAWPDSKEARRGRQARRRERLNAVAQKAGYWSWDRLASAALAGRRIVLEGDGQTDVEAK